MRAKYTQAQREALLEARRKKQEKYWHDRAQSRVKVSDREADLVQAETARAYRQARDAVRREIDRFYQHFASSAGLSEDEARAKLSRRQLGDFQSELRRKKASIEAILRQSPNQRQLGAYLREFERLSKVRELTRKEMLAANLATELLRLGGKQEQQMTQRARRVVGQTLKMTEEDLSMLGEVQGKLGLGQPEQVMRAAREKWQHGDFSDKIWADKAKLIEEVRTLLEEGFARHKGAYALAGELMTRMGVSHSNALRLVRTEFNHLSNQATLSEYKAKGVRKYKFVAAIDSRTSDLCEDLNGKIFSVSEAKIGKNFPPMHPNCRSVTVPVMDWSEDDWDYSGIELDDDELKALNLDDDDLREIDAERPKDDAAPAPQLSVQKAHQAVEDTASVRLRAQKEVKLHEQALQIEHAANGISAELDLLSEEIRDAVELRQELKQRGIAQALPSAALEAERLEKLAIELQKEELQVLKLQERAAKLDSEIPKPKPEALKALKEAIESAEVTRALRQAQKLSDRSIVQAATPKPFDTAQAKTAAQATVPESRAGKRWKKLKDRLEKVKESFDAWLHHFEERTTDFEIPKSFDKPTAKAAAQATAPETRTEKDGLANRESSPKSKGSATKSIQDFSYRVEGKGDLPRSEALKLADKITERRKTKHGGQLFTAEETALIERWSKAHPNRKSDTVIAVQIVGKRPVVVDRAGMAHMLEAHGEYLVQTFDTEDDIIDGLYYLLNNGQKIGKQREYRKKGDSSPRIVYKGQWHGKTVTLAINVDDDDRIFGVNKRNRYGTDYHKI